MQRHKVETMCLCVSVDSECFRVDFTRQHHISYLFLVDRTDSDYSMCCMSRNKAD